MTTNICITLKKNDYEKVKLEIGYPHDVWSLCVLFLHWFIRIAPQGVELESRHW